MVNGTSRVTADLCGLCFIFGALNALGWPRFGLILSRPDEVPRMGRLSLVFFNMLRFSSEFPSVFSNFDLILMKPVWSTKVPREVLLLHFALSVGMLHCRRRLPGRWTAGAGATETYYVVLAEVGL